MTTGWSRVLHFVQKHSLHHRAPVSGTLRHCFSFWSRGNSALYWSFNRSSSSNLIFPGGLPSKCYPSPQLLSCSTLPWEGHMVVWLLACPHFCHRSSSWNFPLVWCNTCSCIVAAWDQSMPCEVRLWETENIALCIWTSESLKGICLLCIGDYLWDHLPLSGKSYTSNLALLIWQHHCYCPICLKPSFSDTLVSFRCISAGCVRYTREKTFALRFCNNWSYKSQFMKSIETSRT